MKRFLLFTTPLLLAGAIYISIPKKNKSLVGDPMEENANERLAWELRRLADSTGKIPDNIREKELAFAATLPNDFSLTATNRSLQQTTWNPRGPWNVGGRTRAFAIDKLNENHVIAGSTSGGIWSSMDGGVSWTKVTPLLNYHGITCLVQDVRAGHETTWYAGSGEPYGQSASGGSAYFLGNGVLKSTDNGQTWSPLAPTTTNTPQSFDSFWDMNWNMATDRFDMNNDVIYTACLGAIYKSVNGGTNWTTIRGGNTNSYSYFTDVATTDSGIVYATLSSDGPQRGIWRSVDQGTNWTKISTSLFGDSLCNRVVMGINPQNNNEIYFLGNTEGLGMPDTNFQGDVEYNVLWRYTYLGGDGSGSNGVWEDLSMNLPTGQQQGQFSDFNAQGSYDLVVAVKPDDSNVVFIAGTNIYRSTSRFNDNTNTTYMGGYAPFTDFPYIDSYTNHHPDNHVIAFLPSNPDVLFNANDGGVFKTMDCMDSNVSWTSLNNGYFTTQFYTVALDHGTPGSAIIAAGAQDNGTWWTNATTLTTPWTHPRGGDGSYAQIENGAGMYYFSIQKGKMNKATLDANGNPTAARRIDPIGGEDYQFINPFALDPNNQNIMYLAGGKYLWRNSNLSQIPLDNQWDSISTNWTRWNDSIPAINSFMTAVTVCKTPANRVYYGTDKKRVYRVDNANTGTPTPVDISATTFPATGFVSCVAVNPNNGDDLIVSFSNYSVYSLFHSMDAGATWTKIAGNLEQNANGSGNGPSIRWVSYLPVSDGMVYLVSTSTGLYATDTLAGLNTTWVRQGETSIGAVVCDMTDVRVSDGTVIVGTHANGIYSATITSVNDIVTVRPVEQAELFAMTLFPNPTSDEVTLSLNLAKDGEVVVSVLDELGRLIRSERKRYVAGEIRHGLPVRDLIVGVYYVRVETSVGAQTKTLMIAR
jgi:photosystem II stability/assembly factor-like uncharacterized protein